MIRVLEALAPSSRLMIPDTTFRLAQNNVDLSPSAQADDVPPATPPRRLALRSQQHVNGDESVPERGRRVVRGVYGARGARGRERRARCIAEGEGHKEQTPEATCRFFFFKQKTAYEI